MLTVHHSNDLDRLADLLAAEVAAEPLAALATEIVVVPAISTARWLSIALADRLGISANTRFVLPAGYAWELIGRVLPDIPERSPLSAEPLFWRLAALLRHVPDGAGFDAVRHYLRGADTTRRFELARGLAEAFERYATYRPHWLTRWMDGGYHDLGPHEAWQAALLRALVAEMPELPHVHPSERFFSALQNDRAKRQCLPARLTLFGTTTLPPLYLEFFHHLSAFVAVTLYLPNPCREYWGQIVRGRTIGRIAIEHPEQVSYFDTGNRLFAALAQHGRTFFNAVLERGETGAEVFIEPDSSRLLGRIQRAILDLVEPAEQGEAFALDGTDDSIRIDVCHGAMREADVLHDRLLGLFAGDPTLRSEDVLILTPDIDRYGSAIGAVFGAAPSKRFIPFALADRDALADTRVVRTLMALLDLASGRFEAEAMIGMLDLGVVRARFGIEASEISLLRDWTMRLGIRWGKDGSSKAGLGLPAERATTWQAGFDRLILGAALGGAEDPSDVFMEVVPFDDIEGAGTHLAGRFAAFARRVFELADAINAPRRIGAWSALLVDAMDNFLACETEDEQDAIELRRLIIALSRSAEGARFTESVPFGSMRAVLESAIDREASGRRMRMSGVPVADLTSARVVPARVVCLVGMNDDLFPRRSTARDFDLMDVHPAPGDPRRRDEDRYAFLLALGAARERLLITYTGRDARTDTARPPSVVVSELLDAVRRCARSPGGGDVAAPLITHHPLQPFSARYGGGLVTYAEEWHPRATQAPRPFRDGALPGDATAPRTIMLEELTRFWGDPSAFFLRERMGVVLARGEEALSEHEPFGLRELAAFRARHALVEAALRPGERASHVRARMEADALLPSGDYGGLLLAQMERAVRPLVSSVLAGAGSHHEFMPINLEIAGWRLAGTIEVSAAGGRLEWRAGRIRASDRIRAWIRHLVGCVVGDAPKTTTLIGWDSKKLEHETLRPLERHMATEALATLLALVEIGLSKPLAFFPEASMAFAQSLHGDPDPLRALTKARLVWYGSEFDQRTPEGTDPYIALAMRDCKTPLDAEFEALAGRVLNPLIESLGE